MFDPWVRKIPLEKKMATHSSILDWEIPRTEEPGGLLSWGRKELDMPERISAYIYMIKLSPHSIQISFVFP